MPLSKIPILTHTHDSFAQTVHRQLGKGLTHAGLLYEEFFRKGTLHGKDAAFRNAQVLLNEMRNAIEFQLPTVVDQRSDGSTTKLLLKTHDNLEIESVVIPMQSGGTLCVSSQVGCRMGCTFCETGRMGLLRNLTCEEIVSQIFVARHHLKCSFRNVVFMGMGEPFDNYDNVMQAIRVLYDPKGFAFGQKNITVSTSGVVEGIERLISEIGFAPNLAVSLNSPVDSMRNRLMPISRKHNMEKLHQTMHAYCTKTERQILVAYVLIHDLNDRVEHADMLADYLQGLSVKINLIPYNPQSHDRYAAPLPETCDVFASRLRSKGYYTLLRQTKGRHIMAACGQLGNVNLRKSLRALSNLNNSLLQCTMVKN